MKSRDVVCMDHKTVLTVQEYKHMVHALGLTRRGGRGRFGRRWAYRNFSAGFSDIAAWRGLVERGLAWQCYDELFKLTRKGIAAIDATRYVTRRILDDAP